MRKALESLIKDPLEIALSYPTRIPVKKSPPSSGTLPPPPVEISVQSAPENFSYPAPSPSGDIKDLSKGETPGSGKISQKEKGSGKKVVIIGAVILSLVIIGACSFMTLIALIPACMGY